jgi:CBS domain containing-hemolysin-like protein
VNPMSDLVAILVALALLAGNAFFVGAEFALISARRTQIEPRAESGSRAARMTLRAMENVSLMMAGAQLGITAASLGLGAVGEPAVAHLIEPGLVALGMPEGLLHPVAFVVAMTVVVFLHMVLGEMVPKNIAIAGPDRSALLLGPPLYAVVLALKPVLWLLNQVANLVLRVLRVEPQEEVSSTFTREEVAGLIAESRREGLIEGPQGDLLEGALSLEERTIADVVVPFEDLVTVGLEDTVDHVESLCVESGFSRFPVAAAPGDLRGYLHVKDLLGVPPERAGRPFDHHWIRPLVAVAGSGTLRDAVAAMQRKGAHMARVADPETGSVSGVVMLEDALEEMVGEVRDAAQRSPRG